MDREFSRSIFAGAIQPNWGENEGAEALMQILVKRIYAGHRGPCPEC